MANLIGAAADLIHGLRHIPHLVIALFHVVLHLIRLIAGLVCIVRVALYLSGNEIDRLYQVVNLIRLLGRSLRQALRAAGDALSAVAHLNGNQVDLSHGLIELPADRAD